VSRLLVERWECLVWFITVGGCRLGRCRRRRGWFTNIRESSLTKPRFTKSSLTKPRLCAAV
jgi:hypothetical protein